MPLKAYTLLPRFYFLLLMSEGLCNVGSESMPKTVTCFSMSRYKTELNQETWRKLTLPLSTPSASWGETISTVMKEVTKYPPPLDLWILYMKTTIKEGKRYWVTYHKQTGWHGGESFDLDHGEDLWHVAIPSTNIEQPEIQDDDDSKTVYSRTMTVTS